MPSGPPWIAGQLGNVYEIRGTAVRFPSLLDRLTSGAPAKPYEVTVVMDVNRAFPNEFYQPTTRVPVSEVDGRWYISRPLLQPETEAGG